MPRNPKGGHLEKVKEKGIDHVVSPIEAVNRVNTSFSLLTLIC